MRFGRAILGWVAGVLATSVAICLIHSVSVQAGLARIGVELPITVRADAMARDLAGLLPSVAPVMALALAGGFVVARVLRRLLAVPAGIAYPLAGATAVAVALTAMNYFYHITPIAGARGGTGFGAMTLAGALGGLVYWLIGRRHMVR